jgi:hypothetical protein
LGISLLYLGYKLTIEWYESDKKSRERVASRIDFGVTHGGIALIALTVVAQQYLVKTRIGLPRSLHNFWLIPLSVVAIVATALLFMWYVRLSARLGKWWKLVGAIPLLAMFASAVGLLIYTARIRGPVSALLALVLGVAPLVVLVVAAGALMLLVTVMSAIGGARLIAGDSEDNPGPSPFDVL